MHLITGEEDLSDAFLSRVSNTGRKRGLRSAEMAASVFISVASTAALYSKAITHVIDFFTDEKRKEDLVDFKAALRDLSDNVSEESRGRVLGFVYEALRECIFSYIDTCRILTSFSCSGDIGFNPPVCFRFLVFRMYLG